MDDPAFDQDSYRFRDDDGGDADATWRAALNTDVSEDVTAGDVELRLRILIQETAGNSGSNFGESWEFDINSAGSWTALSAVTTGAIYFTSTQYTDGDETTQQLGAGTYVSGTNDGMAHSSNGGSGAAPDFAGSDECEFEQAIRLVAADLNDGDTLDWRIRESGFTVTDTRVPRITIVKAGAERRPPRLRPKTFFRRERRIA